MKLLQAVSLASALTLAAGACKEKVEYKPDPNTQRELEDCRENLADKKEMIALLESEGEQNAGGSDEVTVKIDGDVLTVVAGARKKTGRTRPRDVRGNAKDEKLYEAFVSSVRRSRGSIKKCYQNALKKNSALQARTITLKISVGFRSSGKMKSTSFNPRISEHFNRCMTTVAKKWELPAAPRAVTFQTKLTLTPE